MTVALTRDATLAPDGAAVASPRERILTAAYELFCQRGIRDVSVDEVIAASDVAKATLYRHFPSKDDLVLAFLERREQLWTYGTLEAGARARADNPIGRLLAIFDVYDEWFHRDDFEACTFVNVLLELGRSHPAGKASSVYLSHIRALVARFARDASLRDPEEFARSWFILMKGAIIQATDGDLDAAKRGKTMARLLIAAHR